MWHVLCVMVVTSVISAVLRTYCVTHREPRYVTPLWDAAIPPGWVVYLLRHVWAPLSIRLTLKIQTIQTVQMLQMNNVHVQRETS